VGRRAFSVILGCALISSVLAKVPQLACADPTANPCGQNKSETAQDVPYDTRIGAVTRGTLRRGC
jgi:hypothetical protein